MATIRDVAKHALVSPATASLVLRDASRVRPELRKRVEDAIEKLGYERRPVGRPRQRRRTINIGLVYSGAAIHENDRFRSATGWWFTAIRREIGRQGHHLSVFSGPSHVDQDPVFQRIASEGELDGLVIVRPIDDGYVDWARKRDMPLVVINREPRHHEFSHVSLDNYGSGRKVAEFFLARGHRRLAWIGQPHKHTYQQNRWAGFRDRLAEHGLQPVAVQLAIKDHRPPCQDACQAVIEQGVTGVFCVTDGLAGMCVDHWARMGVSIPRDLSVIGFDNTGLKTAGGLRLSSVGFDGEAIGQAATDLILKLIQNGNRFQSLAAYISTQIVEYDTTAKIDMREQTCHDIASDNHG